MESKLNLIEALEHIDPASLSYQDWLSVGMGLKEAGYPASAWDDWSRRDPARYNTGECEKKWNGFHGSEKPITAGTIVQMARSRGWQPVPSGGRELGWDDIIGADNEKVCVTAGKNWPEKQGIAEPVEWHPGEQLIKYLKTLFAADDKVGYVTHTFPPRKGEDGKVRYSPQSGVYNRTAGELIEKIRRYGEDIGAALGDYNPEAGAWIRINPLDGKGPKDGNVTEFRYALVESDKLPIETQYAIIKELELPVAALVYSGNESLHAIVRIGAENRDEYNSRVRYLYDICEKNGLKPDRNNKNPSRLSRMPGVIRNGHKQFLVDTNIGKSSWNEWRNWIENTSADDELPDPEDELLTDLPELAPTLIENILRQGHKMLLAGPSKAGKSYALIELAICIAEGLPWLGFQCAHGKVMYVNLELDRASCLHRFHDVRQAMGAPSRNSVDIWNLRGKSVPMDQLAPKLIRRAMRKNYIAIIIDPIYKVITGDENSADQMAKFCNQFDKVCTELGCAVIYCHHHSKGSQGSKRSMDRASGSGVFARDPDALLDLIELPISEDLRKQELNNAVRMACSTFLDTLKKLGGVSPDDLCSEKNALKACKDVLNAQQYRSLLKDVEAAKQAAECRTAWRIDGTLREFPKFPPVNLWFDFPVHRNDESGVLGDIDPEGEVRPYQREKEARKKQAEKQRKTKLQKYNIAIESFRFAHNDEYPTVRELFEEMKQSAEAAGEDYPAEKTVRNSLKNIGYIIDKNSGRICPEPEKDSRAGTRPPP